MCTEKSESCNYRPDPEIGSVWLMPRSTNTCYRSRYVMTNKTTTYGNECPAFLMHNLDDPDEPPVNITAVAFWNNAEPEPVEVKVSFDWLYEKRACLTGMHKALQIMQKAGAQPDTEFSAIDLLKSREIDSHDALWILEKKGIIDSHASTVCNYKQICNLLRGKQA